MGDPFDFDDDGEVSPEEEGLAFLMLMDDDDEDEDFGRPGSRGGCLCTVLMAIGVTAAAAALPFLL